MTLTDYTTGDVRIVFEGARATAIMIGVDGSSYFRLRSAGLTRMRLATVRRTSAPGTVWNLTNDAATATGRTSLQHLTLEPIQSLRISHQQQD